MKQTNLTDDEMALLEQYRLGQDKCYAAGFEEGLKSFQLVLSIISLEPPPTRDEYERLILQEADRVLKVAPPLAKCASFGNSVMFYGGIHEKRTGKKHNE